MAVAPLFVVDMTTLKTVLRLEGARAAGALAEIDQSVTEARVTFYRRLGKARIDQIKATATVDAPDTNEQILRTLANTVEVAMVRQRLMRLLPMLFMDGSGNRMQLWNEETGFDPASRQGIEKELARLETEIQEGLAVLAGEQDLDDESTVSADTIGPTETTDLPGASIWPGLRAENRSED